MLLILVRFDYFDKKGFLKECSSGFIEIINLCK